MGQVDSQKIAASTLQAVRQLGQYGRHFQSQDVRVRLDYAEGSEEAHYMHNVLGRLTKQGIIAVAGDKERKRNRYFNVVDETALRRRLERPKVTTNGGKAVKAKAADGTLAPAPQRVLYLEDRVAQLEDVVTKIDSAIGELKEQLDAVDQKVTDLVQLWS